MGMLKHILISNMIMLLVPYIAVHLQPFSNQINMLYQLQINPKDQDFLEEQQLLAIDKCQLTPIRQMPIHSRYILSHCQFDGIHFLTNTYNYQPNFAFIKGYTTIVRAVNYFVDFLFNSTTSFIGSFHLSPLQIHVILLVVINKILFYSSAIKLQKIALYLTKDQKKSQLIAILFLYNPSSIFFHSVYTQSIYTFLTFTAILQLFKSSSKVNSHYIMAVLFLSLAVFFRTNGIFLAPVFGVPIIFQLWLRITNKSWKQASLLVIKGFLVLLTIIAPLIWYQYYAYRSLCSSDIDLLNDKSLRQQCLKTLPNLYNFIQTKFWSVGFLSYWKPSNIIFILIGLPAILITLTSFKNLLKDLLEIRNGKQKQSDYGTAIKIGLELSFVILLTITITLTNIQSSTRFLSSHVVFYMILESNSESRLIRFWIFTYLTFGGILFCVGFPWT